jgi:hypothetical protein
MEKAKQRAAREKAAQKIATEILGKNGERGGMEFSMPAERGMLAVLKTAPSSSGRGPEEQSQRRKFSTESRARNSRWVSRAKRSAGK